MLRSLVQGLAPGLSGARRQFAEIAAVGAVDADALATRDKAQDRIRRRRLALDDRNAVRGGQLANALGQHASAVAISSAQRAISC